MLFFVSVKIVGNLRINKGSSVSRKEKKTNQQIVMHSSITNVQTANELIIIIKM